VTLKSEPAASEGCATGSSEASSGDSLPEAKPGAILKQDVFTITFNACEGIMGCRGTGIGDSMLVPANDTSYRDAFPVGDENWPSAWSAATDIESDHVDVGVTEETNLVPARKLSVD
jgi:hypothetical protein